MTSATGTVPSPQRSRDVVCVGKYLVTAKPVINVVNGEQVRNESCRLEVQRLNSADAYSGVDVELSALPSRSLLTAYGLVYLSNFKIERKGRSPLDDLIIEQVAFDAIIKFYHPSVSVLTTPMWFDALGSHVGVASLASFAERFNLRLDTKIGTMIRKGNM